VPHIKLPAVCSQNLLSVAEKKLEESKKVSRKKNFAAQKTIREHRLF
jgi:hypothetical protein